MNCVLHCCVDVNCSAAVFHTVGDFFFSGINFFVKCFAIRVALPPVSSKALIVIGFGLPFLREFILINTIGAVC